MNRKQKTIKKFITKYNKDMGDFMMPKHLNVRWNGTENRYYHKIWDELNGNEDQFLFDDFCEIGFDLNIGSDMSLSCLMGDRLDNLYKYSKAMLSHYTTLTIISSIISLFIKNIITPVFYFIILPIYVILRTLWSGWIIFANYFVQYIKELITGEAFR